MTQFVLVLLLFLLAFAGLGMGLLLKRRGLRSGCGHTPNETHECRCETELDASVRGQEGCRSDCSEQGARS